MSKAPSPIIEYGFYFVLAYATLAKMLGVMIPLFGAGVLAGLTVLCLMHVGKRVAGVYRPVALALACGISILLIQWGFHGESILQADIRQTITWIFALIVIQTLSCRKGFLHRFTVVAFLIGVVTLPYMKVYVDLEEVVRIGIKGSGLANPNAMAAWFGFCYVYFLVAGLETRNYLVRVATWSMAFLSLYLVGITVTRGPLLAMAIATILVFQKALKRSFVPILVLLIITGWIYILGLFDDLIGFYMVRGYEESGRLYIWSESFSRFLSSIVIGEGFSNAIIRLPGGGEATPHNSFLFIGLSSGLVPLIFYLGYLFRVVHGAFRARTERTVYAPFLLPLTIYVGLEMMILSNTHMFYWGMVVLSISATSGYVARSPLTTRGKEAAGSGPQEPHRDVRARSQVQA